MYRLRLFLLCLFSGLLALYAMQQAAPAKPITKRGLLDALKIGGLTTPELVRKLKERGVNFAITPDVEDELRKAGASTEVIAAARDNYHGPAPASAPAKPPIVVAESVPERVAPAPVQPQRRASLSKPGVYARKGDQWVPLISEVVNWKKGSVLHKIPKFGKGKSTGVIPGAHSPNSYRTPVKFVVVTETGLPIGEYVLTHLHDRHDDREFEIDASRTSGRDLLPFAPNKTSERVFQVDVTQGPGEYGFLAPATDSGESPYGKMYTFRILE